MKTQREFPLLLTCVLIEAALIYAIARYNPDPPLDLLDILCFLSQFPGVLVALVLRGAGPVTILVAIIQVTFFYYMAKRFILRD